MADELKGREVFIEIQPLGHLLRVTAIDAATGIEAILSVPRSASPDSARSIALNKLRYILEKKGHLRGDVGPKGSGPGPGTLA